VQTRPQVLVCGIALVIGVGGLREQIGQIPASSCILGPRLFEFEQLQKLDERRSGNFVEPANELGYRRLFILKTTT